jgi:hypothetical protein
MTLSLVTWFWPFKKNVVSSPSRVNESKRPSSSWVKDEDEDITFLRNVASHNKNCRVSSPATVPQITLPVTHSYTLYTLSDTPEFTISLNVQVMSVLSPYVMTAILTESQFIAYCCPSDRNVSHQLRSIYICVKHTHTHTHKHKMAFRKWVYVGYLDLKKPWEFPHTFLVWGQASILSSIRFQSRSWSKIMGGLHWNIISKMALVMIW